MQVAEQVSLLTLSVFALRSGRRTKFSTFSNCYREFLEVCASHYDFQIFVDGYKEGARYAILKASGFPVKGAIHLLRDPRAYAASAKRAGVPVSKAARDWVVYHRVTEWLTRLTWENVLRVRYEDLCDQPQEIMASLQRWMGLKPDSFAFKPRNDLHWLGNSSVFDFNGQIRTDERWRNELSPDEISIVSRRATKAAHRYGYDLSSS
jgi:hypothetical protein